jgi:hypothetical protein
MIMKAMAVMPKKVGTACSKRRRINLLIWPTHLRESRLRQ